MIYKGKTKVIIINNYVIEVLQGNTETELHIGDTLTVEKDIEGAYIIYEIEDLPKGWSPTFVENDNYFKLAVINNWQEELQ